MKKLSIIIPNWNGQKFLEVCLNSLRSQSSDDFDITIVDNGSTDNSVEFIENNYPEVNLIKLPKNVGFAPAVNAGIRATKSDLIGLINNDTELNREWVAEAIKAAEENPEAGFFATKMLDFKDHTIIDSCGDMANWWGKFDNIGRLQKNNGQFDEARYVFGACAGAAVYRRELFESIGLFDETFFAYLEDIDISFRAQLAGFKCLYIPTAMIYHIGSATSGKKSAFSFKLVVKNRLHVIYKNFPWQKIVQYSPFLFYVELRFFLASIKNGFVSEYFWAVGHAITEHHEMVAKRKKIQKDRKVSIEYLNKIVRFDR